MNDRPMCPRGLALAAALCALLVTSVVAADDDSPVAPVIPPLDEQLVANLLGRGMTLNLCTLVRGGVEFDVIKATYTCLVGGEVTLELDHPRNATPTSIRTGQFALTVKSGSPPRGFQDALASLVRSQEGSFQWSWPQREAPADDDDAAE
jgi:hypothetical protein